MSLVVRALPPAEAASRRDALVEVATACVAGGASVGFMDGWSTVEAGAWWEGVLADLAADRLALFGAELDGELVGTGQLGFSSMPNGRFRGEVRKILVHPRGRRHGIGAALMAAIEAEAKARGLRTLVLDTATGSDAERLYSRLGWTRSGVVPDYALFPDGRPCETTIFWKAI